MFTARRGIANNWLRAVKAPALGVSLVFSAVLTAVQPLSVLVHRIGRPAGYISTAFLVACANASLVGILSEAYLSFPARRSLARSPRAGARPSSQVVLAIQSWTLRQAHPRAPPVQALPEVGMRWALCPSHARSIRETTATARLVSLKKRRMTCLIELVTR